MLSPTYESVFIVQMMSENEANFGASTSTVVFTLCLLVCRYKTLVFSFNLQWVFHQSR